MAREPLPRGAAADFKHPAGKLMPVVNAERCEGAGPCLDVCPVDVFEMRKPTQAERAALSWKARVKVWVHGGQQAFVVRGQDCRACGLCVSACPERAITLARYAAPRLSAEAAKVGVAQANDLRSADALTPQA